MIPAESVLRAAKRWLRILRGAQLSQAWALIRADSQYADLTPTQYTSALEWLKNLGVVTDTSDGIEIAEELSGLGDVQIGQILFERGLEYASPPWLPDADLLVPDASEIPSDAAEFAQSLGVSDVVALSAVMHVHGKIDLARRALIGESGEKKFVEFLESIFPGTTTHIALDHDGFGYDVVFRHQSIEWHLEVKSTTRRGRLAINLSRHEHEVGLLDPNWRLIVLGLDEKMSLCAMATVKYSQIVDRTPQDLSHAARWQSVLHQLGVDDLEPGLVLADSVPICPPVLSQFVHADVGKSVSTFEWMPN